MRKKVKKSNVFTSFCRLCLNISNYLIDITTEEQDYDIIDVIFDTTDIKLVKQHSILPKQFLCPECLEVLQFIKKFKEGCRQSLEVLTKCVIYETPKDLLEVQTLRDRKRLKELIVEAAQVQEETLIVQTSHYQEIFKASKEITSRNEELEVEKNELKSEIKVESIDVKVEEYGYDSVQTDNEGSETEKKLDLEDETNDESKRNKYKKYQCEICLKSFDGYDYKYHMNTHLKIFPFKCDEKDCDRKFTSPSNLASHRKTHDAKEIKIEIKKENLMPCDRCGLKFTRKKLYNHFKRDHADEQYKCEEQDCGQVFANLLRLRKHEKRVHSGKPKQKYTCELCGKAFRKTRLKYHMNIHLNIKPFVCDFEGCTKACPDPGQLAVHKRIIHLKTIKIVCKICNKPFKTKADHDIHFTYHGTPSLPCKVCGRLLMNRKTLAKHMLVHTGEKKYKCTFEGCTRAFPVSTGLSVHMRSHTKEKPYLCQDCPERFTYRIGLRRHAQKIHGKVV